MSNISLTPIQQSITKFYAFSFNANLKMQKQLQLECQMCQLLTSPVKLEAMYGENKTEDESN